MDISSLFTMGPHVTFDADGAKHFLADGRVIDLRMNRGGSNLYGSAVAPRLTKTVYSPYSIRARIDPDNTSRFSEGRAVVIDPSQRPGFDGNVLLSVRRNTVSAGETCALALYKREGITLGGEPTQGAFSSVLNRFWPKWPAARPTRRAIHKFTTARNPLSVPGGD